MQTAINNTDTELENLEYKCKSLDDQIDTLSQQKPENFREKLYLLLVEKTRTIKRLEFLKDQEREVELKAKRTGKKFSTRRNRMY